MPTYANTIHTSRLQKIKDLAQVFIKYYYYCYYYYYYYY
jgi:hypothetical protein